MHYSSMQRAARSLRCAARRLAFAAVTAAALTCVTAALAQTERFPDRPIRVVVLFPAGNGIDTHARTFSDALANELGQPVVVDNKPGGNGIIALQAVKSAPADGYTVLISSSSPTTIATAFGKSLPYDPFKDFKPVGGFIRSVGIFTVPGDSTVTSIRELVAAAKAKPDPATVGTYADAYYLTSQQLANMAGFKLQNVPYKGQSVMLQDLIGGRVDMAYGDTQSPQELIKVGKLRALAVTGASRHVAYPSVPTVAESGFPDFTYYSWNAFFVRSETPAPVAAKLGAAIRQVLSSPDFQAATRSRGAEPMLDDVPMVQRMMVQEVELYKALIAKNLGANP